MKLTYMIGDGDYYIRRDDYSGQYVPVRNMAEGDEWESQEKAENILKNAVRKKDKESHKYKVMPVVRADSSYEKRQDRGQKDREIEYIKEIIEKTDPTADAETGIGLKLALDAITKDVSSMKVRRDDLNKEVSNFDREISDIQHYIELKDLSSYQESLVLKMLKNILIKRRKAKLELEFIDVILQYPIGTVSLADVEREEEKLRGKRYHPRVLTRLFETA